jgi:hypothetical protein
VNTCCAQTYWCPTVGEWECGQHGGFDTCCLRPDLHCWEHPVGAMKRCPKCNALANESINGWMSA